MWATRHSPCPSLRYCASLNSMAPLLLSLLSYDVQVFFVSMWLDVTSLANLDGALTSHDFRPYWMMLLHSLRSAGIDELGHSFATLMWVAKRGICARSIQMKVDGWRVRGCDLLLLETIDLVHLGLDGCLNITDQCILNIVHRCRKLNSLDVRGCKSLTDVGISGLAAGCGRLQSINLSGCNKVADTGVSALS